MGPGRTAALRLPLTAATKAYYGKLLTAQAPSFYFTPCKSSTHSAYAPLNAIRRTPVCQATEYAHAPCTTSDARLRH